MKEILVRSTFHTDTVSNSGFLYIKDSIIEGIFSLDYVKISLDGNQMVLDLKEHIWDTNSYTDIRSYIVLSSYSAPYKYEVLYVPDTYLLCNEKGEFLSLNLEEPIYDSNQISCILQRISEIRN